MDGNNPACNLSGRVMHLERLFDLFFSGDDPKPISIKGFAQSMIPAILPGEVIHIAPVGDRARLRVGDVAVFRWGDIFIAHRILRIRGGRALTKGDNNPLCDPWVPLADIVGVVEGKSSRRRALLSFVVRRRLLPCLWALAKEKISSFHQTNATDKTAVRGEAVPRTPPYQHDHLETRETP